MKAIVMAGGEGSRLRPLTCDRPKPMVPILNVPVMEHIIRLLKKNGITEIAVTLQYMPEMIQNYFGDGHQLGVNLFYSIEDTPLGTAGSVKKIENFLDETFLVISGDALTDFNLEEIIDYHHNKKSKATIALTRVENPLEFGVVITNEAGQISRFLEKPAWSEVFSDTINTGIYVLEPEILQLMEPFKKYDFSQDIFPLLLNSGEPIYGYTAKGYWCDIGSPEQYMKANFDALNGAVKLETYHFDPKNPVTFGADSYVSYGAHLVGPILLGQNCKIRRGAEIIGPTIIGDNCIIDINASIKRSLIWDNSYIGENSALRGSHIGSKTKIKECSSIFEEAFIGDQCSLQEHCVVKPGVKIWPNKLIEAGSTVCSNVVWGNKWGPSLFGPHGISGLANIEITPEFATKLGAAFGTALPKQVEVTVSCDSHRVSKMLSKSVVAGLLSTGVGVVDLRLVPAPLNRFAIKQIRAAAGIHISMSPFNPEIVDLKFFDHLSIDLPKSLQRKVENLYFREEFRKVSLDEIGLTLYPPNITDAYTKSYFDFVDSSKIRRRKFKIALDHANGNSTFLLSSIIGNLGCEVISLNAHLNEQALSKSPDDFKSAINNLTQVIIANSCDLGLLLDSGGEKLFIITDSGQFLSSEEALGLFAHLFLKINETKSIAFPINTSRNLEKLCLEMGAEVSKTKANDRSLMEISLDNDVAFAGDNSDGYVFPQMYPFKDALIAMGKLLEFLAIENLRLSELVQLLPNFKLFKTSLPCPANAKGTFMRRFIEEVEKSRLELFDGVKIISDEDWVLVLPDPNQPLLHLFGENLSSTNKSNKSLIEDSLSLVKQILKETNAG